VGCYRGSEDDVLDRVLQTAKHAKADLIVELTGDCPLLDPVIMDCVIEAFLVNEVDYCSNGLIETYPRGMDVQVFPVSVLERVAGLTVQPEDREHVSLYIYEHPDMFRLLNVESKIPDGLGDVRLTVDTKEDFELVRHIYEELYPVKPAFGLEDILHLLSQRPDLRAINRHVRQKAVR
jgi:spore coat polysaccharide biosynthesis protein SpsF